MFRFEEISYLLYLGIIPILIGLFIWSLWFAGRKREKFAQKHLYDRLVDGKKKWKRNVKFGLTLIAFVFLCIALANPQWGYRTDTIVAKSSEVFIALDVSNSMMAEDISPNRLERAKRFSQKLLKELKGDRVGLILFAGNAYLQVPITHDLASVELFVKSAHTGLAATQGTNITEAIKFAEQSFSEEEEFKRALIIITDGENHDELALSAAAEAKEKGIMIHAIGVGTSQGGLIPYKVRGAQFYKKDKLGNPIKSKLNVDLIRELASSGGGESHLIDNQDAVIESISASIDKMEKRATEQQSFSEYNSYFQYFLFVGLVFLLLEYLLAKRTAGSGWLRKLIG